MLRHVFTACLFTLCVEVPIVAWFYREQWRRMAVTAFLATSATNLAMNLGLLRWASSTYWYLVIGETSAVIVEAYLYFRLDRSRRIDQALIASATANSASFLLGLLASRVLFR